MNTSSIRSIIVGANARSPCFTSARYPHVRSSCTRGSDRTTQSSCDARSQAHFFSRHSRNKYNFPVKDGRVTRGVLQGGLPTTVRTRSIRGPSCTTLTAAPDLDLAMVRPHSWPLAQSSKRWASFADRRWIWRAAGSYRPKPVRTMHRCRFRANSNGETWESHWWGASSAVGRAGYAGRV